MQKGCLCKAGKCLVRALYHHIRSAGKGSFRKPGPVGSLCQMGAVCLINQNRDLPVMTDPADSFNVRQHALISRACQNKRSYTGMSSNRGFHLSCPDTAANPPYGIDRRKDPTDPEAGQFQGMKNGLVAVAGTEHFTPPACQRPYAGKQTAGAAVDQIPGPVGAPYICGPVHGLAQNTAGIMEVVHPRDLRHIPGSREPGCRLHTAFMPRHMKRIQASCRIVLKLCLKYMLIRRIHSAFCVGVGFRFLRHLFFLPYHHTCSVFYNDKAEASASAFHLSFFTIAASDFHT